MRVWPFLIIVMFFGMVWATAGAWPFFSHDLRRTGLSPYSTSDNPGTLKWKFKTDSWVESSPAISSDGTIYFGSGDYYLYALYPNGTLKWKYRTGGAIGSSPAISSDGTIYFGSYDYYLYALNPDGTLKWKYETGSPVFSSPAISSGGTIYFGSRDNYLYALYPNGTLKWKYETGSPVFSSPAIASDGTIYFGSDDHYLYALYPNGTLKWKFKTDSWVESSPAISSDGTIYFGSNDNYLYALYPNGTLKWKFKTGSYVYSSPAIASDGTIYFGSDDDYLYALNPDGTLKWKFKTNNYVLSSPAIASDGTIYFGSDDHYLYAIGLTPGLNLAPNIDIPDQSGQVGVAFPDNFVDLWQYTDDEEDSDDALSFEITTQSDTSITQCAIVSNRYIDCTTPTKAGFTDITVNVTDTGGASSLDTFRITVSSTSPPTCSFTANPESGDAPLTVQFDASGTTGPRPIVSYIWDFGDGASDSGITTSHEYTAVDTFTATLTATDDSGGTCTATKTITTTLPTDATGPVAVISADPTSGYAPLTVSFDGSGSHDDAGIIWYAWDFGDGETSGDHDMIAAEHTYYDYGTYTATLTVTNEWGISDSDSVEIDTTMCEPTEIVKYIWDWGDGTTEETTTDTATHAYTQPGTYTITLTAVDSCGNENSTTWDVTVETEYPVANAGPDQVVDISKTSEATLNGSLSYATGGKTLVDYTWDADYPNGVMESGEITTHVYNEPGLYTVFLNVSDSDGLWDNLFDENNTAKVAVFNYSEENPDLAVTSGGIDFSDDFVNAGDDIDIVIDVFNLGGQAADSYVSISWIDMYGEKYSAGSKSVHVGTFDYTSVKFYGVNVPADTVALKVYVKPVENETNIDNNKAQRKIYVNNRPNAVAQAEPGYQPEVTNPYFQFYGYRSTDDEDCPDYTDQDNCNLKYFWDFGDGTYSSEVNPTHGYSFNVSIYRVRLDVWDSEGAKDTGYVVVGVGIAPEGVLGYDLYAEEISLKRAPIVGRENEIVAKVSNIGNNTSPAF
ncbi:MAG: PQQ-binding-like beta-propeller repeat protein, partial [Candidatus Diapherotrites archaeon]|nr:PQQ-binding-like beta-propeller repeat protein [Candidatus Diapherotrites archaeon]